MELAREVRQDIRHSVRVYARRPLVTCLALAALALAIGATTGAFSVVNALLLRSLPFQAPERIVHLLPSPGIKESPAELRAWLDRSAYLEDAIVFDSVEMSLARASEAHKVRVTESSANFFRMLGSEPIVGRGFARDEDVPGNGGVFGGVARCSGPIRRLEPDNPLEVFGVVGDQDEFERQGMSPDQRVERPDRLASFRERGGDRPEATGCRLIERHDRYRGGESVNQPVKLARAFRLRTEAQLRQRDGADAQLRWPVLQQPCPNGSLPAQRPAHRVRVEHVLEHQSGFRRSRTGRCASRGRSSRHAPKHARKSSGHSSAGSRITRRPSRRTSTSRCAGKRHVLGRRTA